MRTRKFSAVITQLSRVDFLEAVKFDSPLAITKAPNSGNAPKIKTGLLKQRGKWHKLFPVPRFKQTTQFLPNLWA